MRAEIKEGMMRRLRFLLESPKQLKKENKLLKVTDFKNFREEVQGPMGGGGGKRVPLFPTKFYRVPFFPKSILLIFLFPCCQ